jgi:CheY-like chemotaxis protein
MPERILIVDDNQDAADALARLVSSYGYEVKAVYSGSDALQETESFQPDMALVDLGMPGIDGFETVTQLRQRRGNVHLLVVAVTGWTRDEDKRRAYEAGFDLHVGKPVTTEILRDVLELLGPIPEQDGI